MVRQIALIAAVASVAISGVAAAAQPAAKLANVKGSVLVSQNGKFVPVNERTVLRAGDRVLATNGAGANLVYADGCNVAISARSMATVAPGVACEGGSSVVKAAYQDGYNDDEGAAGFNADLLMYVGFGLLTFGVVGSALSDDETPTSP